LTHATRSVGTPYLISPTTPEEEVQILPKAMKKIFQDPEFQTEFRKLGGEAPSPPARTMFKSCRAWTFFDEPEEFG
jgi:hypothetical protein